MQTKTLLFGLTVIASVFAAPVAETANKTVTTQSSGAGIWKRAKDAEMSTNGAGIWKREEDAEMHTAGAGIWKREEDAEMHTTGAGIWKKSTEESSESAPQVQKRTGYGIISGGNDEA
ncbi:uncharacterized protein PG986_010642 [Apiospora aurea]|uniref:Mating factor alpha n=1 Tax=Apiospora aurea TaxID=335848 RepID=A0ABR1Q2T7_9PEZI